MRLYFSEHQVVQGVPVERDRQDDSPQLRKVVPGVRVKDVENAALRAS